MIEQSSYPLLIGQPFLIMCYQFVTGMLMAILPHRMIDNVRNFTVVESGSFSYHGG